MYWSCWFLVKRESGSLYWLFRYEKSHRLLVVKDSTTVTLWLTLRDADGLCQNRGQPSPEVTRGQQLIYISIFILGCLPRLTFWGEISPFCYHLDRVRQIWIYLHLVKKMESIGHMRVCYPSQKHLPLWHYVIAFTKLHTHYDITTDIYSDVMGNGNEIFYLLGWSYYYVYF